jgi:ABC-type dipeptide/oligopeptide/nickel transport system permease component
MPETEEQFLERGIAAAREGKAPQARQLIAKHLMLHPSDEHAWLWLGRVAKDDRELERILAQILKIRPDNPYVTRRLRTLRAAQAAADQAGFGLNTALNGAGSIASAGKQPRPTRSPERQARQAPARARRGRKEVLNFFMHLLQRILSALILLIALVLLVSLAMELARSGGVQSFPEAAPNALHDSLDFFTNLVAGNLEAMPEMLRVLPRSLGLLAISLALGALVGLLLGALAAIYRHRRLSGWIISFSVLGVSTPSYVAAMFLIWSLVWLYGQTGLRLLPSFGFGWDLHLILPCLVLATRPMANMTRLSYSALLDTLDADFVRTAHSKGLLPRNVFLRHVLRNAGVPLLTTAGVAFRFSLGMLPIVEYIFSWPGIGLSLLEAIQRGDLSRVLVMLMPLALLFVAVNIILSLLYEVIDPRLRSAKGEGA